MTQLPATDVQEGGAADLDPADHGAEKFGGVEPKMIVLMALLHVGASLVLHAHKLAGVAAYLVIVVGTMRPLSRLVQFYLVGAWRRIDQESVAERESADSRYDMRPFVVLSVAAAVLLLINFFGSRDQFGRIAKFFELHGTDYYELLSYVYWSGFRVGSYILIPWFTLAMLRGERFSDCGLSGKGFASHLWIYGVLYLIILPLVIVVSYTAPFQRAYPFYGLCSRSWYDLLAWEFCYSFQFFALEVFFRGFMLHPLKRRLGSAAIFVMTVPYAMIHFRKPAPEAFGAIVAGVVLGTLSLRTRSIWAGVLVHVTVALTMDALALTHRDGWPKAWF